jgi:hypothetical protein
MCAERLRLASAFWKQYNGPVDEHRLLDRLSLEEWEGVHRLHCAHHLSFAIAVPDQPPPPSKNSDANY